MNIDCAVDELPGIGSAEEFFGCRFQQVNKTIRMMALAEPESPPLWLRGKRKWADLPRVSLIEQPHCVSIKHVPHHEIAERVRWICEELHGAWSLSANGLGFENHLEAIHYRLRFD